MDIEKLFKGFKKKPVAFIGSGISKRYMNTPTWEQLLKMAISEYNPMSSHYGQLMHENDKNFEKVAACIEKEYNNYFYTQVATNPEHKDYPLYTKYQIGVDNGTITPYKLYTSKIFADRPTNDTFANEKESFINMLGKCANIITTNYDSLIEDNTPFKKVVGSKAFINDQCIGFGELYKIHGCCNEPNSIVITEKDYEDFNKKRSFYHAKLLISFIEKPIIFLGYSISDKYIQKILEDVSDSLDDGEINNLANRLIFIEYDETKIQPEMYIKQISKINMTCIKLRDYSIIYDIISDNVNVGIPLELVRMFQEAVKNFVYEQDNPTALAVKGVEDIKDIAGLTAFHVGMKPVSDRKDIIKPEDLIEDILLNNLNMNSEEVLKVVMRETKLFPRTSFIPLYRYIKESSTYNTSSLNSKLFTSLEEMYGECQKVAGRRCSSEIDLINEILSTTKTYEKLSFILSNIKLINTKTLRYILTDIYLNESNILAGPNKSNFRKLVCMLDYLESL